MYRRYRYRPEKIGLPGWTQMKKQSAWRSGVKVEGLCKSADDASDVPVGLIFVLDFSDR